MPECSLLLQLMLMSALSLGLHSPRKPSPQSVRLLALVSSGSCFAQAGGIFMVYVHLF